MFPPVVALFCIGSIANALSGNIADKPGDASVRFLSSRRSNWTIPSTPSVSPRALIATSTISNTDQCEGNLCEQLSIPISANQNSVTPHKTVVTVTSCSANDCTEFVTTSGYSLVTSDDSTATSYHELSLYQQDTEVSYSTSMDIPEPVAFEMDTVIETRVAPHTTVITVTSCSEHKCSHVKTTTGLTVVTSEDTIYTTYCPLTSIYTPPSALILLSASSILEYSPSSSLPSLNLLSSLSTTSIPKVSSRLSSSSSATSSASSLSVVIPTTIISSTVVEPKTTVITVTSCSEDKCSHVKTTTGYTVVTSEDTIYTTYCPLTSIPEHPPSSSLPFLSLLPSLSTTNIPKVSSRPTSSSSATSSAGSLSVVIPTTTISSAVVEPKTTVITVTSCSEDKCSHVKTTTGYTVVTSEDTIYTTYCPLTSTHTPSSAPTLMSATSSTKDSPSPSLSSLSRPILLSTTSSAEYLSSPLPRSSSTSLSSSLSVVIPTTITSSTVVVPRTTVITITSCSEDKCTEVKTTTGYTLVSKKDTVYTTYCPLTSGASRLASSTLSIPDHSMKTTDDITWCLEPSDFPSETVESIDLKPSITAPTSAIIPTPTVIVVTSCSGNLCSENSVSTGIITVTSGSMGYTTYCPLSDDSSTSTSATSKLSTEPEVQESEETTVPVSSSHPNVIGPSSRIREVVSTICDSCAESTSQTSTSKPGQVTSVCEGDVCKSSSSIFLGLSRTTQRSTQSIIATSTSLSITTYEAGCSSIHGKHAFWIAMAMVLL